MARLVGALAMVSLGLVVLGAAGLVVRIGRTLDGARDAIGSITPSITTHRETDAALEVADAGAWSARPPERPSASRARTEPVIAATQEAETLLEAMTGRLCPSMTQLLADGRARCGCARPERDLRQRVQEACGSWVATQVGALTREVAERDEERITACLDRIARAASACSLDEAMTDCHDLLREPASLGDECGGAAALCRRGVCSDGTCVPQPRPGEPAVGGLCAPGLVVDDGTCVERRREGARCRDEICEFGLYCIGYVCTRPRPAGGACESTGDCDDGLLCRDGRCVAAPRWCEHQDACGWAYACDETFASHCVPCADCQGETVCADDETVCGEGRACEDESRGGRCAPELCGDDALPEVFRR